ncbi:MAG TPA: hypothetical protein PKO36_07630 [Candidatus Hydrogenedentes bacterium]|nr:hypothetical protein [Candidatus Hydrogenedentota bacterium]
MASWVLAFIAAASPAGQIAYLSGADSGSLRVHVLDLESRTAVPVGPGQSDGAPAWSPDGAWLAFATKRTDGMGIVLARPDASETRAIAHTAAWNAFPQWSPDGRLLAYESGEGLTQRIVVYDIEGGNETVWGGGAEGFMRPVWLPNHKLLYAINADPNVKSGTAAIDRLGSGPALVAAGVEKTPHGLSTGLFFMTSDSVVPVPQETLPSATGEYAEWFAAPSPNGLRLAFESNDGGDRELFCYTHERAVDLSNHRTADWNPVWSPDSRWLAFESFRGGRRGVYCVFVDTARVAPVVASPDFDTWSPSWSPDGKWIAYVSNCTGDPEIHVCNLSGKDLIRVTDRLGPDYAPVWRPKGQKK